MEHYDKFLTDNNNIFIYGEINNDMASKVNRKLIYLDRLKVDDNRNRSQIEPVWIWINSNGGSVTDGLSIIDTMSIIHLNTVTVITGTAYSMAGIISISGDARYATPNSSWMMHDSFGSYSDYGNKLDAKMSHSKKLNETIVKILKKKTKLKKKDLDLATHHDLYLNSEECIQYNIIDDILTI